ncbi:hypothetical protein GALMADRAFT_1230940 [Galerina marginata CBS 339.88]|uniref:Uncharacterized protein n=1 Tax=Galerina marginata (strain CBS 339.88) TaxID=685588 RepID=A0A067T7T9_GALM3|nr:hypothetical protein GALMADRAFT_1230940 [Galerina marginata CBS 339.88]
MLSRHIIPRSRCGNSFRTFSSSKTAHTKARIPEYYEGRLEGTVPDHICYILLHVSRSPETFPSVYHTPVSREMHLRAKRWGGLVNFSWFADRLEEGMHEHSQSATVFSPMGGKLEIPHISLENLDRVEEAIQSHLKGPRTSSTAQDMHIYVCTHGARDCRCGDRGREVYLALVEAAEKERATNPDGVATSLKIGEVGHVGGHKYAANLLVFPQGEWLGIVKPEDAPSIIKQAYEALRRGVEPLDASTPPWFLSNWRGRMGLSKEEQQELWTKYARQDLVQHHS